MTINDVTTLLTRTRTAFHTRIKKHTPAVLGSVSGRFLSLWRTGPEAGSEPGGTDAPTNLTAGSYPYHASTSRIAMTQGGQCLSGGDSVSTRNWQGALILCDRLSQSTGLNTDNNSAQTTNLPTAALTRYTTGAGVMCGFEVYAALSGTNLFDVNYTDQDGNASTVQNIVIGNTPNAHTFHMMPLAAGDTGIRAVTQVTLTSATNPSARFGVTLFRPLALFPLYTLPRRGRPLMDVFSRGTNLTTIEPNACLFFVLAITGQPRILDIRIDFMRD